MAMTVMLLAVFVAGLTLGVVASNLVRGWASAALGRVARVTERAATRAQPEPEWQVPYMRSPFDDVIEFHEREHGIPQDKASRIAEDVLARVNADV